MLTAEEIGAWPGKTVGESHHPALWHMLDVGAVARCLLDSRTLTNDPARDEAFALLVALHDLGKLSANFRDMLLGRQTWGLRHWQHSYRLLLDHDQAVAEALGGTRGAREILYAAVAGHHGGPPEHLDRRKSRVQARQIGAEAHELAPRVIAAVAGLFPNASLAGLNEPDASRLSWVLCGLTVQADWIGSNTDWFGPRSAEVTVGDYWTSTMRKAAEAVSKAGLHHARPQPNGAERVLPGSAEPRPMQAAVAEADLPEGAILALIEDAAQAFGGTYRGKWLGSHGDAGAFSFNIYKTITCGDGGMLVTGDEALYRRCFAMHDQGHAPLRTGVEVGRRPVLGLNFRMVELQGAVLLAQLAKLDRIRSHLSRNRDIVRDGLAGLPGLEFRRRPDPDGDLATHLVLVLPDPGTAQRVAGELGSITVAASGWHVYSNMEHLLDGRTATRRGSPFGTDPGSGYRPGMLPRTDALLARSISIGIGVLDPNLAPVGLGMSAGPDQASELAGRLRTVIARHL